MSRNAASFNRDLSRPCASAESILPGRNTSQRKMRIWGSDGEWRRETSRKQEPHMNQSQKNKKRIVSKCQYLQAQGKRIGFGSAGCGLLLFALLFAGLTFWVSAILFFWYSMWI